MPEPRRQLAGKPVLSLRDASERDAAALALARGEPALFYLGLYTAVRTLRPAEFAKDTAEYFWRVKPDRPRWSKLPLVIRPRDSLRLLDFSLVHPDFRAFGKREAWEQLWAAHGAPLHVIAPLRQPLRLVNPAFQTTPSDLSAQAGANATAADRAIALATASCFWMEDPDWHDLALRVALYSPPNTFFGGTSFNDHGEHPPYTFAELEAFLADRQDIPFELIISDSWFEGAGIHSSHTMVRLPLVNESPEWVMIRRGSVSAEFIARTTGHPVRSLASTAEASSQPGLSQLELERRLETFVKARTERRMRA